MIADSDKRLYKRINQFKVSKAEGRLARGDLDAFKNIGSSARYQGCSGEGRSQKPHLERFVSPTNLMYP